MQIKSEPYAWPYDGNLTPDNTALLVIDMQIDFCAKGGWCAERGLDVSRTASIIPALQKLLTVARKVPGLTVIHTREGHRADLIDLPDNKLWRSRLWGGGIGDEGPMGRFLTRGNTCWDIVPELYPIEGEPVIDKCGKGSFVATDLEQLLRLKGIKNLIFTGVTAECCVHTTMRHANDLGFECVLLSDCTESVAEEDYSYIIEHTKRTGLFGVLSDSIEIMQWMQIMSK